MISLNSATLLSGSGIDVNSLVSQVLATENGQLQLYQQRQSDLQTQATLLSSINDDLSGLSSAVASLKDVLGPLSAMEAKSSQTGVLTATAQPLAGAGVHTVVVSSLATQGTLYTDAVANEGVSVLPNNASSAQIQFQLGGVSGTTHSVAISSGSNDTLKTLAKYINNQNWGVTASVISDASGARLAIYSGASGSTGTLAITSNTSGLNFNPAVGGTNATFTVDGIPFSSTNNVVNGAVPGVTLNLLGAYPGVQAQVTVAPDLNQASDAINTFVDAYNAVITDLNKQFTIDPSTNTEGPLAGDSALRSLQASLLRDATYSPGAGSYVNLRSLGITMNDNGTLSINAAKLNNVLSSDPASVIGFFQKAGDGFAVAFGKDLQNLTSPSLGVLNMELAQNQTEQLALSNSVLDFQARMTAQQHQLTIQFSQVNALLQQFPSLLQAVQLELGIMPSGGANK
jgi:flagellar hook-associated protein 2